VSVVDPRFFNTHHMRLEAANSISDYDTIRKKSAVG